MVTMMVLWPVSDLALPLGVAALQQLPVPLANIPVQGHLLPRRQPREPNRRLVQEELEAGPGGTLVQDEHHVGSVGDNPARPETSS